MFPKAFLVVLVIWSATIPLTISCSAADTITLFVTQRANVELRSEPKINKDNVIMIVRKIGTPYMTIEDKQTPEGWQAVNDGYGRWCYIKSDLGVLHSIPIGSSLQSVLVSYGSALAIGLVVGAILCWLHLHRVYFFERKVVQL